MYNTTLAAATMEKKRIITSFEKLSPELQVQLQEAYPDGYVDSVKKYDKPNGDYFYAISLSTEEANYLVKVPVKIDEGIEELDEDLFGDSNSKDDDEKSQNMVEYNDDESYDD